MKFVLIFMISIAVIAGYSKYQSNKALSAFEPKHFENTVTPAFQPVSKTRVSPPAPVYDYECDGRQHCSQMGSCEEALFFIRNCPNTKMDGDGDGIPCERQWCTR